MIKHIYKLLTKYYNDIESMENIYEVCEPGNPYGHIKEFNQLNKSIKYDVHRVISTKALKLYLNNKMYGSAIDINGNRYDFDIFQDGSYRVFEIYKYKEISKEAIYEGNISKNS